MRAQPAGEGQLAARDAPPPRTPISVVIADDHDLYRQSLALVLSLDGDIDVVGKAGNGFEALDLAADLQPDVVLLDLQMPRLDGVSAIRSVAEQVRSGQVIMLTMSEATEDLLAALRAGANGYLLKSAPAEEVIEAIRHVHAGRVVVSPSILISLLSEVLARDPDAVNSGIVTDRVRGLLRRMARGASIEQIAAEEQVDEHVIRAEFDDLLLALREAAEPGSSARRRP